MMSPLPLQFVALFLITLKRTTVSSIHTIVFGIHTPHEFLDDSDASGSIVTLTLFWEYQIYQCNVYPINESKYYSCDTSDASTTLKCDTSLSTYPMKYGIQIDNDDWDHAVIDKVIIRTSDLGKMHEIIRFCFNNQNCTNTLTLLNDYYLIPFNISKTSILDTSNVYVQNHSARCSPDGLTCKNNNCTFDAKYKLIPIKKTWWHAQEYCHDVLNSSLATITSKHDLNIAVAIRDNNEMYFNNDIWIGYTDSSVLSSENKWKWIDTRFCDSNNNKSCDSSNVFWGPGEPNNEDNNGYDGYAGEDCAEIRHQYTFGLFNDIACTEERFFFCNDPQYITKTFTTTMDLMDESGIVTGMNASKYIMLGVIIIALILIIATCICLFFYYKKYIREQIKKERIGNETDVYYDVQPGQETYSEYPVVNDINNISPKLFDRGYNMVKKNSLEHDTDEEDEKEIVIIHNKSIASNNNNIEGDIIEGYVDETKISSSVILMENMVKQYSSSNNNSDDMYDNSLIVEDKHTPTVKDEHILGYEMIENEQKDMDGNNVNDEKQSSNDDIYDNPNDNINDDDIKDDNINDATAGILNVDGNTIGNIIDED